MIYVFNRTGLGDNLLRLVDGRGFDTKEEAQEAMERIEGSDACKWEDFIVFEGNLVSWSTKTKVEIGS